MNGPIGSSCPELLYKKGALKNFVQLTEKQLCRGRLLAKSMVCNFLKKESPSWFIFVNFAKFLRTPILKNINERLLLAFGNL